MDGEPLPLPPTPGRGAPSNQLSSRFALPQREADGDWLDEREAIDGALTRPRTEVSIESPRTIIARNTSPDIGFDRSINPYRGCEHGCIYCYARPSHAWLDLSPGLDFETRLVAKPDAATLLRSELATPSYRVAPLAIGTNTDGYQPIERDWAITRSVIAVLAETRHPLILTTKSDRLLRDIALFIDMARDNLIFIALSITTLDPTLARTLEPRAPAPHRRLAAIARLADAGIPVQVNVSPIIPAINDHEMEQILARAAEAGATRAIYIPLRLPHEVAPLFRQWLAAHYPDRAAKVMAIVQAMRGGRDNDPRYGARMHATGIWAELLRTRFRRAVRQLGLDAEKPQLNCEAFRPPLRDGAPAKEEAQLPLL